ncbi:hypothetical protein LZ554_004597 [Drepanopeziza brunnea f. sp. 'monogermtubi']|nr:hypothetical protein LZ554_004597 [Drepanopeziza brunnea f. sp. 'monogermtubi']
MPLCDPCDRWFNSDHAYQMHLDNSILHVQSPEFECEACDRTFSSERSLHQHCSNSGHPYCIPCKRMFRNHNNLTQHQHSKTHVGRDTQCPFCRASFVTVSGFTIHLESGSCPQSNLNRPKLNNLVQRLDRNNVITRPMLTMPGYENVETVATERAWNGSAYACYLCTRKFASLRALNSHLSSPAHEEKVYRCPGGGCGRNYTLLSGLIQHVESESCGVMRFAQVQKHARNGIENMIGRMITN